MGERKSTLVELNFSIKIGFCSNLCSQTLYIFSRARMKTKTVEDLLTARARTQQLSKKKEERKTSLNRVLFQSKR